MKTLILTVEEYNSEEYKIRLSEYDGSPPPPEDSRELAVSYIPTNLSLSDPPINPDTLTGLVGPELREMFVSQRDGSPLFLRIGEYLSRILLGGEVGLEWERLRRLHSGEGSPETRGCRTYLNIRPPSLRVLPWELMTAPGGAGVPLALDRFNPILRGHPRPPAAHVDFSWPLHAMIVVGTGDKTISAGPEIESVKRALCRLDRPSELEVLEWPSNARLVEELQRFKPHIFHFIGHGRAAPGTGEPMLEFADQDGNHLWSWSARDIVIDLQGWQPRFACLNACRSAVGADEQRGGWGITEAFIEAGVTAVVGMQADVRGRAAALLPARLYEALLTGSPLDVALAQARDDIRREDVNGLERRDWALAALHVAGDPAGVLTEDAQEPTLRLLEGVAEFARVKSFVDRKEPRRKLQVGGAEPAGSGRKSLLIVVGEEDTGKTWLVYWCLKVWALRGLSVKYVDLEQLRPARPGATKSLLGVMRAIRGGRVESYLQRPLPEPAFEGFDRIVASVLDSNRARVAGDAAASDEDELPASVDEDEILKLCEAFRDALHAAAEGRQLIIALDGLNVRRDHFTQYLTPYVITHIALHKLEPVRMVLIVDRRQYEELDLASLRDISERVEVPVLYENRFDEFAEEFFRYHEIAPDLARSLIKSMKAEAAQGTGYKPEHFWKIIQGLRGI